MNWKDYETVVYEYFAEMYPDAHITPNAKIAGRLSKRNRQIDVLIEDDVADYPIKIVIDAKYRSRKITVNDIESFISMIKDVGADTGVLITPRGYSEAAIQRAHNSRKIELVILNFDELSINQYLAGIPYAGKNAIIVHAPIGWIIDNSKHSNPWLACLYQRGLNIETAMNKVEFMYVNFWQKDKDASSVTELVEMQNKNMEIFYETKNLSISTLRSPKRRDGRDTYIRVATADSLPCKEITGFIDCDEYIVFFVLYTREELERRNVRNLSFVLKYSIPYEITFSNTKVIRQLKDECKSIKDFHEKALANLQIAKWYSETGDHDNAMKHRRLCWKDHPEVYQNIKPLIRGELELANYDAATSYSIDFFSLDPFNPGVMQDLLFLYAHSKYSAMFCKIIKRLKSTYSDNNEALGNISFHYGMYLLGRGNEKEAISHYKSAKKLFELVNKKHAAIKAIKSTLKNIENHPEH